MIRNTALFLTATLLVLAGCAVNPVTGKRQLVLISESQEIAVGRENDSVIVAQMGLYPDEELQRYIQELGDRLAAESERPHLDWTFRVLDDPVVNAFALPGGYIYITRGIMSHLNNEAELASVLGHEIGHVTARHGVSQMTKAQLAQIGLVAGAAAAPELMQDYGALAEQSLGLLFLKFGRDDERQSDDLALRYMTRGGFDPRESPNVYETLRRVSAAADVEGIPGWMSTHPAPENRKGRIDAQIVEMNRDFSGFEVGVASYAERIDGLVFGPDPRDGYFKDSLFLHPEMAFRMQFPDGWKTQNQPTAVVGLSEAKDAIVLLTLSSEPSAGDALRAFFAQGGVARSGPSMGSINNMTTAGGGFSFTRQDGQVLQGRVGFVEYGGHVFELLGYCAEPKWADYEATIRGSLASFDRLHDRRVLEVQPKRLRFAEVDRPTELADFAARNDATVPLETLALINRVDPDALLEPGRRYKVVVGGELP